MARKLSAGEYRTLKKMVERTSYAEVLEALAAQMHEWADRINREKGSIPVVHLWLHDERLLRELAEHIHT